MSIVPSTTFLLKNKNYKKAMTIVFHITFLFQRSTNKFKAGQNSVVQWSLVNCSYFLWHYQNLWQCLFKLLLVKILLWFHKIMPMETKNFGLRYIEIFLLYSKLTTSLANSNARVHGNIIFINVFLLICTHYYRMKGTISILLLNHKQSFLESFNRKTLKNQHRNS